MKLSFSVALAAAVLDERVRRDACVRPDGDHRQSRRKVADQQGGVLPGATVNAVHTPTGTTYQAVTDVDGRYVILNVRVGSPYKITVTMSGFTEEILENRWRHAG